MEQLVCLPLCLPAYLPACLPSFLPSFCKLPEGVCAGQRKAETQRGRGGRNPNGAWLHLSPFSSISPSCDLGAHMHICSVFSSCQGWDSDLMVSWVGSISLTNGAWAGPVHVFILPKWYHNVHMHNKGWTRTSGPSWTLAVSRLWIGGSLDGSWAGSRRLRVRCSSASGVLGAEQEGGLCWSCHPA